MVHTITVTCAGAGIKEIKLKIDYFRAVNGYDKLTTFETKWLAVDSSFEGEFNLPYDVSGYCETYLYIIVDDGMSYKHKFVSLLTPRESTIPIIIEPGQYAPIVTMSGKDSIRCDDLRVCSARTFICGCCDVQRGLDDIEQSEYDAKNFCNIL